MTEVPPFLFMVTSTALVLGVAITIRGLLGFRPPADDGVLPPPVLQGDPTDALLSQAVSTEAATAADGAGADGSAMAATSGVRDLREPIVMTIAGILIVVLTLVGISALVNIG